MCSSISADPHALLKLAINDRRLAGLHHHSRAAVHDKLDALAVAKIEQSIASDAALFLAAVRQVIDAAMESICEPYSPVVTWPTGSPSARTVAHSAPRWRSVSILSLTPQ